MLVLDPRTGGNEESGGSDASQGLDMGRIEGPPPETADNGTQFPSPGASKTPPAGGAGGASKASSKQSQASAKAAQVRDFMSDPRAVGGGDDSDGGSVEGIEGMV